METSMKSAPLRLIAALALAWCPLALAHAADLTGTVTAPDGSAFRGAFVQAENAQTKLLVSVLTDNQGRYRIADLPAGEYRLAVRAPGYAADPKPAIKLDGNGSVSSAFRLRKDIIRWTDISQY